MVENQAIARIERLGQDRVVQVIRYLVRGTVEEVRISTSCIVNIFNPGLGYSGSTEEKA